MIGKPALQALAWLFLTGCISRGVDVVPFLPPTERATLDELVEKLEPWRDVRSLVLRVDLQFETVLEAEAGRGRQYRTAQGRLLLRRPDSIRLDIEAPVLSANIAEMASDGERFQLLIHPPEYRALIEGRNDARYENESAKLDSDPELSKAGPLVNIRPQHFTDAFLLSPIRDEGPYFAAFHHEEIVEEPDPRPGARKDARVRKSYQVVTAVRLGDEAPRTQYWFDAVGGLRLARQRSFDADGRLVADVQYSGYLPPDSETGVRLASTVRIERPRDEYTLVVHVRPDGVTVNRELPDTAFLVTVPPEWGESLRRIDLDERSKRGGLNP